LVRVSAQKKIVTIFDLHISEAVALNNSSGAWWEKWISQSDIHCHNIELVMHHPASTFYKIYYQKL
jgi:hypothetical protein